MDLSTLPNTPVFPSQHPRHDDEYKGEEVSNANKRFLELAKNLQDIFVDGASPTAQSVEYGRIRHLMQRVLNVNQVSWLCTWL